MFNLDFLTSEQKVSSGMKNYFSKVFFYMAFFLSTNAFWVGLIYFRPYLMNNVYFLSIQSLSFFAFIIFVLINSFSNFIGNFVRDKSAKQVFVMFFVLANLTGILISSVGILYYMQSILQMFLLTSVIFGVFAIYGYTTSTDLISISYFIRIAMFLIIPVSLLNVFIFKSSGLEVFISFVVILMMTLFIASQIQILKVMYEEYDLENNPDMYNKVALMGAYNLYSSFINIMLRLLQLFGRKKND